MDLQDYIRALNAFVLESIKRHSANEQIAILQPSASKTFLEYGYTNLHTNSINSLRANRGYFAAIRPGEGDILLNINTATSAFLPPSRLPDFLEAVDDLSSGKDDLERNKRRIESASKLLQGSIMTILYTRGPFKGREHIDHNSEERRTVKFTQFGRPASQQKFFAFQSRRSNNDPKVADLKTGKTVEVYFKEKNLSVTPGYLNEICVNVGKHVRTTKLQTETYEQLMCEQTEKGALWIPACFLQIKENQQVKSTLPGSHNTAMRNTALRAPAGNAQMIETEGFNTIGIDSQPLKDMDFSVAQELLRVPATPLTPPSISYSKNGSKEPSLASWNIINMQLYGAGSGHTHVLTLPDCFGPRYNENDSLLNETSNTIMQAFNKHGMNSYTAGKKLWGKGTLREILIGADGVFTKHHTKTEDCTVFLVPKDKLNQRDHSYIKRIADRLGKHTVCARSTTLVEMHKQRGGEPEHLQLKDTSQKASNIVLKINLKYGGENHRLFSRGAPLDSKIRDKTIVIGADVAHPGKGSREGTPSVASLVGSMDGDIMRYRGAMRFQAGSQEKIEDMKDMTMELLKAWKKCHQGKLPENILFYRDGVSEGQFSDYEKHEIAAIDAAFKALKTSPAQTVKITFVVVVKRHHARFYALNSKDTYQMKDKPDNGNVKPGMLVEKVVTNRVPYNFFLQSHQAIRGTVRPAHYYVLQDGMRLQQSRILCRLTHTLCYAFSRATNGVSYVAPAYMADRLYERGAAYLREWNDLEKRPEPSFNLPNDKSSKLTKQELIAEKQRFAVQLNKSLVQNNGGNWNERKSLWHPDLDRGVFWL